MIQRITPEFVCIFEIGDYIFSPFFIIIGIYHLKIQCVDLPPSYISRILSGLEILSMNQYKGTYKKSCYNTFLHLPKIRILSERQIVFDSK
jgi:hypothetical protein